MTKSKAAKEADRLRGLLLSMIPPVSKSIGMHLYYSVKDDIGESQRQAHKDVAEQLDRVVTEIFEYLQVKRSGL